MSASSSEPRPAATLVILRDGDAGPEVLVTVRPETLRFMAGATVFPGGAIDPADLDPRWASASSLSPADASRATGIDDPHIALGAYVGALREAFEEVGFLLGSGRLEAIPRATEDRPDDFLATCLGLGVRLATDRLVDAGSWVTPMGAPVRFDTRFFCVRAAADWVPDPDPTEVASARWVTPRGALEDLATGEAMMAPPTVEMLQRLDGHDSVDEILAAISASPLQGSGAILSMRLSPLVHVTLAPNPGPMTGPGTNTYVVGSGPTVVIDPAVDDAAFLDAVMEAASGSIDQILVTHRHSDHIGGVAALVERTGAPVRAFGTEEIDGIVPEPVTEGEVIEAGGATLRTMHCPGHASDHLCWVLEGAASLFAGDNILGEGTAVIAPPDGDMNDYMDTLERLATLDIDRIYPGHFRPLDGGRRMIEGYIEHRAERIRQLKAALADGATLPKEVVAVVYRDTPEELRVAAEIQVVAQLEMLERRGEVRRADDRWFLIDVD
ncbi:MAG TPA: MBL fold metallo-hydrolase [Actinomycetota bacterium]|nr:MBL fold metallo-hydrolase [Actinomycetota bacterium]